MNTIYRTISGSRLYGLEHENSDYDYYTVVGPVKKKKATYATHAIVDGIDSVVVDFGTWLKHCDKGVPQALEAMFSRKADIDLIPEFRASFFAGTNYESYRGMMYNMAFEGVDDFKHRRHVMRLGVQLGQLRRKGRFNPTLSEEQVKGISVAAERWDMDKCFFVSEQLAWNFS